MNMLKQILILLLVIGFLPGCGTPTVVTEDPCSGFDENECLSNETCQPTYGSGLCSGSFCTADLVYKGCIEKSEN